MQGLLLLKLSAALLESACHACVPASSMLTVCTCSGAGCSTAGAQDWAAGRVHHLVGLGSVQMVV